MDNNVYFTILVWLFAVYANYIGPSFMTDEIKSDLWKVPFKWW